MLDEQSWQSWVSFAMFVFAIALAELRRVRGERLGSGFIVPGLRTRLPHLSALVVNDGLAGDCQRTWDGRLHCENNSHFPFCNDRIITICASRLSCCSSQFTGPLIVAEQNLTLL